jgi:hypothetical protein
MKLLNPGHVIDGFEIEACLHAGGMAHIYTVQYALSEDGTRRESEFPMAMKQCYVYNVPLLFSQLLTCIVAFVDKDTQRKMVQVS